LLPQKENAKHLFAATKGTYWRDLMLSVSSAVLIFFILLFFDAFEVLYEFTRAKEDYELDEAFLALIAVPIPLAWFAYRRAREAALAAEALVELERYLEHSRRLESLGTMASGVAHELNNQLLPIMSMAELVHGNMAEDNPDYKKIDLILKAAANAKKTVAGILSFSKVGEDHNDICEFQEACHIVEEMLEAICPSHISLTVTRAGPQMITKLAEADLHSVVVNLFLNAVDAIGEQPGEIEIKVDVENINNKAMPSTLKPGQYGVLKVRDTGGGMSSELQARVFDPFFTTKEVGKGVGLGLSIIHTIVSNAGGYISVESEEEIGTTITIYLPVIDKI